MLHQLNKKMKIATSPLEVHVRFYLCSSSKEHNAERDKMLPMKGQDLRKWIDSLNPDYPATRKLGILITYTIFLARKLYSRGIETEVLTTRKSETGKRVIIGSGTDSDFKDTEDLTYEMLQPLRLHYTLFSNELTLIRGTR